MTKFDTTLPMRADRTAARATFRSWAGRIHWGIYPLLVLFALVAVITVPTFGTADNVRNIIEQSSVLSVLVVAEVLVLLTGRFDLSVESTVGFAPMVAAVVVTHLAIPSAWGIPTALLVGALVGAINGFLIVKVHLQPFIATLGMLTLLRGSMLIISSGIAVYNTGNLDGLMVLGQNRIGGVLGATWVAILVIVVTVILTRRHRFGRALYAIGGNEGAARAAGIPVNRTIWIVYILAGTLAALAGVMLSGRLNSIPVSQGTGMVFDAFAAAVIGGVALEGGKGSILGALSGVLLLGIVSNLLTLASVPSYWVDATRGAIILVAMVIASVIELRRRGALQRRDALAPATPSSASASD